MPFDQTVQVLNEFGTGITNRFKELVDAKGGSASGTMKKEARQSVVQTASTIDLIVDTVGYFKYADEGRGPTKKGGTGEVKKNIRKWIDQKGINPQGLSKDELAFLISRKIHRKGYKGKFYVRDVVTEQMKDAIGSALADAFIKDFNF